MSKPVRQGGQPPPEEQGRSRRVRVAASALPKSAVSKVRGTRGALKDPSGLIERIVREGRPVIYQQNFRLTKLKAFTEALSRASTGTVKVKRVSLAGGISGELFEIAQPKDRHQTIKRATRRHTAPPLDGPLDRSRIRLAAVDPATQAAQRLNETLAGLGLVPKTKN